MPRDSKCQSKASHLVRGPGNRARAPFPYSPLQLRLLAPQQVVRGSMGSYLLEGTASKEGIPTKFNSVDEYGDRGLSEIHQAQ